MKTSEVFKRAKQCLKPIGKANYICHALAEAAYGRSVLTVGTGVDWAEIYTTRKSGFKTAIKVITDRIGSDAPLETWLLDNGIDYWKQEPDQMRAYRHRWLDLLIAEFEAKGD
jgi:hypothetical protein